MVLCIILNDTSYKWWFQFGKSCQVAKIEISAKFNQKCKYTEMLFHIYNNFCHMYLNIQVDL